jgi:hypothetical protein
VPADGQGKVMIARYHRRMRKGDSLLGASCLRHHVWLHSALFPPADGYNPSASRLCAPISDDNGIARH